jgi:hypothetical protein
MRAVDSELPLAAQRLTGTPRRRRQSTIIVVPLWAYNRNNAATGKVGEGDLTDSPALPNH